MNAIGKIKSKVMIMANRFVKYGFSRSDAMRKAWGAAKNPDISTKVKGVTLNRRQEAIAHLAQYATEDINIALKRESNNAADKNAIAVIATVEGKGSYKMGYVPKYLAIIIAPLMDACKEVTAAFQEIRGGISTKPNYGLVIGIQI